MLTPIILIVICSTAEMTMVRMVDGDGPCSGKPELFHERDWKKLNNYNFFYKTIRLLCRELDCGDVVQVRFEHELKDKHEQRVLTELACQDGESAFSECKQYRSSSLPQYVNISIAVSCSDSVRLVDGAGLCSGRVEVKSNQAWTTVCEDNFDWKDAEVVCRELGCGKPLSLQGALFGEGNRLSGTTEFQCKGTENQLLNCSTLAIEEHNCIKGKAVGLTCSGPDDVRLINGTSCAGTVQIFHHGQWRGVTADRWSMREATVVCRQLGCGSAVAATMSVSEIPDAEWGFHVSCVGLEPAMKECTFLYASQITSPVGVICSDSVRLVDGAGLCSGRVEVKSNQSWTTVCEDDFDWKDAEVVCRELGCGAPHTLQGVLYGEEKQPFGTTEFQCKSTEKDLISCWTSRKSQKCRPGKAVGLNCSEPDKMQLVNNGSRCTGTLEVFHNGQWRKVGAEKWSIKDAAVVCKNMNCGSALAATKTKSGQEKPEMGVLIFCDRITRNTCHTVRVHRLGYLAGVVCSEFLVQPTLSVSHPMRVSEDRQEAEVFRGQSFTVTCSIQPQYPGGTFHLRTNLWTNESHTQAARSHSASFFFPAADDSHQGSYICVYENQVMFHGGLFQHWKPFPFNWSSGPSIFNFSSESDPLSIILTDFPLTPFIVRMLVVPFLLLAICLSICLFFKKCGHVFFQSSLTSVQDENVKLVSRAEEQPTVVQKPGEKMLIGKEQEEAAQN